jgi:hypothetical protein
MRREPQAKDSQSTPLSLMMRRCPSSSKAFGKSSKHEKERLQALFKEDLLPLW